MQLESNCGFTIDSSSCTSVDVNLPVVLDDEKVNKTHCLQLIPGLYCSLVAFFIRSYCSVHIEAITCFGSLNLIALHTNSILDLNAFVGIIDTERTVSVFCLPYVHIRKSRDRQ